MGLFIGGFICGVVIGVFLLCIIIISRDDR